MKVRLSHLRLLSVLGCLIVSQWASAQTDSSASLKDSIRAISLRLERDPNNVSLLMQRAAWRVEMIEWEEAIKDYNRVIAAQQDNFTARYYRAYLFHKMQRTDLAQADYKYIVQRAPMLFQPRLALALILQEQKKKTEAMDHINLLVETFPDSALAWGTRAGMEAVNGLLELAEYDFTKALSLDPNNKDYRIARADIRIQMGKINEAIEDLNQLHKAGTPRAALQEWYEKARKKEKR